MQRCRTHCKFSCLLTVTPKVPCKIGFFHFELNVSQCLALRGRLQREALNQHWNAGCQITFLHDAVSYVYTGCLQISEGVLCLFTNCFTVPTHCCQLNNPQLLSVLGFFPLPHPPPCFPMFQQWLFITNLITLFAPGSYTRLLLATKTNLSASVMIECPLLPSDMLL